MLLALTLSALLLHDPAARPPVAVGEHFRVECHFDRPSCAEQALAAAEAVWPIAERLYPDEAGFDELGAPRAPLVVHLYRDAAAYHAAEDELTRGLYRRNQAFAHRETRTAHVAVQPAVGDETLERLGLPEQTLRLIAHEAAHLARFERMPNNALHPGWFVDGNAGFVDQEVMRALGRSPGLERDPWTSQEIFSLQRLLAAGRMPSVREVFRNTLDQLSFHERYAVRHFFFRFLWEEGHRAELERIRDVFAGLERGRDTPIVLAKTIHGILAPRGGMEALDAPFRRYLDGFDPMWEEAHRSLAARDGAWLQLGFPEQDATAWSTRVASTQVYNLSGALELLAGDEPQLNLHFARSSAGFFTITFVAGHRPTLYRYSSDDDSWQVLATGGEPVPVGRILDFDLDVSAQRIELLIQDDVAFDLAHDFDLRGSWGLAAHRGGAGRWAGLSLTLTEKVDARGR